MDRLTEKQSSGFDLKAMNGEWCNKYCEQQRVQTCNECGIYQAIQKLADYEDLEEIFREKMTDTACEFLKDKEEFGKWLDRNKWIAKKCDEYARAEEQELLLRLPVPIGTTVYKFEPSVKETKRYIKTIVTRYDVFEDSIWFTFANGLGRNIEDFGKYVFLTQAEAEQKLKEMESK